MPQDTIVPSVATFLPAVLDQLQNATEFFLIHKDNLLINDNMDDTDVGSVHQTLVDMETIVASVLHDFKLQNA